MAKEKKTATKKKPLYQVQTLATEYNDEHTYASDSEGVQPDRVVYRSKVKAEKVAAELRREKALEILSDPRWYDGILTANENRVRAYWEAFEARSPADDGDDLEEHMMEVYKSIENGGPKLTDTEAYVVCEMFALGYVKVVELEVE